MLSKRSITSGAAENSEKRGQRSVAMERRLEVIKKKKNRKNLLFKSHRAHHKILAVILRIQKAKVCYRDCRLMLSWNGFP